MKSPILISLLLAFMVLPASSLASHDGSFSNLQVSQNSVSVSVGQTANVTTFPPNNSVVNIFNISNTPRRRIWLINIANINNVTNIQYWRIHFLLAIVFVTISSASYHRIN